MEINEDVVINGKLTVVGDIGAANITTSQDVIMGRDLLIDGQSGKLIDNDSNADLTVIRGSGLVLCGTAPIIPNATSQADAVVKLNLLLDFFRSAQTVQ